MLDLAQHLLDTIPHWALISLAGSVVMLVAVIVWVCWPRKRKPLTLADVAKRMGPSGKSIAELLAQPNTVLDDLPWLGEPAGYATRESLMEDLKNPRMPLDAILERARLGMPRRIVFDGLAFISPNPALKDWTGRGDFVMNDTATTWTNTGANNCRYSERDYISALCNPPLVVGGNESVCVHGLTGCVCHETWEESHRKLMDALAKWKPLPPQKFRNGQWLRTTGDEPPGGRAGGLCLVSGTFARNGTYFVEFYGGGQIWARETFLEPALPRKGEWWRQDYCPAHGHIREPFSIGPSVMLASVRQHYAERVECGCLVPSNFGRGEGVA